MIKPEEQFKECADILRKMVRHENELTNQHLTWMSISNGSMLTELDFMWIKPYDKQVIPVFCTLGIIVYLVFYFR